MGARKLQKGIGVVFTPDFCRWCIYGKNCGTIDWYLLQRLDAFISKTQIRPLIEHFINIVLQLPFKIASKPNEINYLQIYVPIRTATDHWFLMVISLQLQTIYHLDTYCGLGEVKPRRATISIIVSLLLYSISKTFSLIIILINYNYLTMCMLNCSLAFWNKW
jgi:hypothetical protein